MFRKLVSSAHFNPKAAQQLLFYAKRLHQEESLRRLGALLTTMVIILQTVAVLAPAKTTNATSPNNLIYGASSKQSILQALKSGKDTLGRSDIKEIFNYYGITVANIEDSTSTTLKSRERSYTTTGRGHSSGIDTPVQIPGTSSTIYERSLNVWDIANYENCYKAITGKATGKGLLNGKTFWVLLGNCGTTSGGCGNITFETPAQSPKPEIIKTSVGNGTVKPNETFEYRINYRNTGRSAMSNMIINDTLADDFEYVSYSSNSSLVFKRDGQKLSWSADSLQPSQSWLEIVIKLKAKSISLAKKRVCNSAELLGRGGQKATTTNFESARCVYIDNSCPGTNLPIPNGDVLQCVITCSDGSKVTYDNPNNCPTPEFVCESLRITDRPAWNKRTYEVKLVLTRGASVNNSSISIDGKEIKDFGQINKSGSFTYTHEFNKAGDYNIGFSATPKLNTKVNIGSSCELSDSIVERTAVISLKKSVSNITQKITDANNKTARGGDELEYTLTISNNGNTNADNYVIDSDNLNDVLEYADLTTYNDGLYDKINQRITWPSTTVNANSSVVKKFTVRVKSPVPTTPPALSDRTSYDYKIRNVFGNEVVVNISQPASGRTYQNMNTLPNTGPGTSLLLSILGFVTVGYFFARSKLLAKETDIINNEILPGV